jgi:hypothetical protein
MKKERNRESEKTYI